MASSKKPGVTNRVVDIDHGYKAFRETVNAFVSQKPWVVTGVFGPAGEAVHPNAEKGETVATVAAKNEFGVGVPERSFLRSTWDMHRDKYEQYTTRGLQGEVVNAAKTKVAVDADSSRTLKRIALKMEGDIKRRIGQRDIPPPNAKSTIARKKSDTPLIDSGHLRRTVVGAVRKGSR